MRLRASACLKQPKWTKDYEQQSYKVKSKRKQRKVAVTDSKMIAQRYAIRGRDESVNYAPLAYLDAKVKSLYERSARLMARREDRADDSAYKASAFYKNLMKSYERVKKAGNDDFLTGSLKVQRISKVKGLGVKSVQTIPKDTLICFYGGPLQYIEKRDYSTYDENHYLFSASYDQWVINGEEEGSIGRYFNHSSHPNVIAYHLEPDGETPQVAYVTSKRVKPNEELCLNYDDGKKGPGFLECTGERSK